MHKRTIKPSMLLSLLFASGKNLTLAALCGMFIASASLAQDVSNDQPKDQQPSQEAVDNTGPTTNQAVTDTELVFPAGTGNYFRDIRLSNNQGGLRFFGTDNLTAVPNGAAIQFFGVANPVYFGSLFLDSGAESRAALIFRTATTGETIRERMRITSDGNVGIGTDVPFARLTVLASNTPAGVYGNGDIGVRGESSNNTAGIGVNGESPNGVGVNGESPNGVGVLGSSSTGIAGRFIGRVESTDSVTATSFITSSDRAAKSNFAMVDGRAILNRLAGIPIQSWNFKGQESAVRHIGPMAQDFYAAFNVGADDKHIATVDADGVALAAIQGLYQISVEKDKKIEQLSRDLETLRTQKAQEIDELRTRLMQLEQAVVKK